MNPPLRDEVWKRRGINVLWDGATLGQLQAAPMVISLRRFFELYEAGWPEDDLPLVNEAALVVAGLDAAIDALTPEDAVCFVEQTVYTKLYDFQNWAESQLALIFWMTDKGRWIENPHDNTFDWHLSGVYKGQRFPLGRCIWNGTQPGVRRIETSHGNWIGLYQMRIS
jgi:hypothetical protein